MSAWWRCFVFSATVCAVGACATPAEGDPIVITSGSTSDFHGEDMPVFEIMGVDAMFQGILPIAGVLCCPFDAGDRVSLSRSFPLGTAGEPTLEIVDGTRFPSVFVDGSLSFAAAPFVAPALDGTAAFRFTTPFTMQGQIAGYANQTFTQLLFSVPLAGSGTAVVVGSERASEPNYVGQGVAFNFEAPAATPEPASLVLFGSGIAGLYVRRRCRRKPRASARRHSRGPSGSRPLDEERALPFCARVAKPDQPPQRSRGRDVSRCPSRPLVSSSSR